LLLAIVGAGGFWAVRASRHAPSPSPAGGDDATARPSGGPAREPATQGGGDAKAEAARDAPLPPPAPRRGMESDDKPEPKKWPGIDSDLSRAPALRWTRVKATSTFIMRKARKTNAEPALQLFPGQFVEVLAEEGPEAQVEGREGNTKVVRAGDVRGWILEGDLESGTETVPPNPPDLWARLRAAVGSDVIPESCPVSVIAGDFVVARPGPEHFVFSISGHQCRWAVGVFTPPELGADLLGFYSAPQLVLQDLLPHAAGTLIQVTSYWNEGEAYHGGTLLYLRATERVGPLVDVFRLNTSVVDTRGPRPVTTLVQIARPDLAGDGQWLVQARKTVRTTLEDLSDQDVHSEEVFAFDGARFSPIARPEGLPEMPNPPPSREEVPLEAR
jgi:hypothetical protein